MPVKTPLRSSAYQSGLRRLARRDHSRAELRRALLRQGHSAAAVHEALQRLERYLDDRAYAARFARARMTLAGQGPLRVRAALRQRGVGDDDVEGGLREALEEQPASQTLESLARRYWERHAREAPARRILKLRAHLLRRGFPHSLVRERLARLWPAWKDEIPEDMEDGA